MSKGGGFGSAILGGFARAIARELLVQTGRKKPFRGGARISTWRRMGKFKKPKKNRRR
jgi:hypothetical protein